MIGAGHAQLEESYPPNSVSSACRIPAAVAARGADLGRAYRGFVLRVRAARSGHLWLYGFGQIELARALFGRFGPGQHARRS